MFVSLLVLAFLMDFTRNYSCISITVSFKVKVMFLNFEEDRGPKLKETSHLTEQVLMPMCKCE